jgi:hypothetical protein
MGVPNITCIEHLPNSSWQRFPKNPVRKRAAVSKSFCQQTSYTGSERLSGSETYLRITISLKTAAPSSKRLWLRYPVVARPSSHHQSPFDLTLNPDTAHQAILSTQVACLDCTLPARGISSIDSHASTDFASFLAASLDHRWISNANIIPIGCCTP